jgi:hypothetical protein
MTNPLHELVMNVKRVFNELIADFYYCPGPIQDDDTLSDVENIPLWQARVKKAQGFANHPLLFIRGRGSFESNGPLCPSQGEKRLRPMNIYNSLTES